MTAKEVRRRIMTFMLFKCSGAKMINEKMYTVINGNIRLKQSPTLYIQAIQSIGFIHCSFSCDEEVFQVKGSSKIKRASVYYCCVGIFIIKLAYSEPPLHNIEANERLHSLLTKLIKLV